MDYIFCNEIKKFTAKHLNCNKTFELSKTSYYRNKDLDNICPFCFPKANSILGFVKNFEGKYPQYKFIKDEDKQLYFSHNEHEFSIKRGSLSTRIYKNVEICTICNPLGSLIIKAVKNKSEKRIINLLPENYKLIEYISKIKPIKLLHKDCNREFLIKNKTFNERVNLKREICSLCNDVSSNSFSNPSKKEKMRTDGNIYINKKIGNEYKVLSFKNKIFDIEHKDHIFQVNRTTLHNRHRFKTEICTICNPIDKDYSGKEKELHDFICDNYKGKVISNNKELIKPYELDVVLEDLKIAIEFNGSWWHTTKFVDKNYHTNKSSMCNEIGYRLFHIWEHDWVEKQDIIKSILLGLFNKHNKIYARKCIVKEIEYKEFKEFVDYNHLQESFPATKYYGLYNEEKLVQTISFKKHKDYWEIGRLCSLINNTIVGGSNKLFNSFLKDVNPKEKIITYTDNDYFSGKAYIKMGFIRDGYITEHYKYYNKNTHSTISRYALMGKSEEEIQNLGYYRFYNSGMKKFVYNNLNQ